MVNKNTNTLFATSLIVALLLLVLSLGQASASIGSVADGAIPVYCSEAVLSAGASEQDKPDCFRSDTRESVMPVPTGYQFMVTDVVVNRNAFASNGTYFVLMGPAGTTPYPSQDPKFDFSGGTLTSNKLTFSAPYVVLNTDEELGIVNADPDGVTVDAFVSGYLIAVNGGVPMSVVTQAESASSFPPAWSQVVLAIITVGLSGLAIWRVRLKDIA